MACHCEDCQRLHGNFFAMLAAPAASVVWFGDLQPRWYASSPASRRAHCPHCGSRLAKQADDSNRVLVSAGLFSRHLPRRIERQVFTESRPDWYGPPASTAKAP